jgi:hypothetical protein
MDSLAVELGWLVATALSEDEVTRLCGRRYECQRERRHTRYGHQRGVATLAGQKVTIDRPRVRRADEVGEVALETDARFQSPDAMPRAVLRRMVRGVSSAGPHRFPNRKNQSDRKIRPIKTLSAP